MAPLPVAGFGGDDVADAGAGGLQINFAQLGVALQFIGWTGEGHTGGMFVRLRVLREMSV